MDRLLRVDQLWSWLPAFRAVGETQHMRQAAENLHVSPSALSRTVSLLQADAGAPLFVRVGRGLKLTRAGSTLLAATRDAMRIVHDALKQIESGVLTGDVRISSPGTITRMYVLPALASMHSEHPQLRPSLDNRPQHELSDLLRSGALDIAMTLDPVHDDALSSAAIGRYTSGVYCGRNHPLFDAPSPSLSEVMGHPFVAPPIDERGHPREGWPVEFPRRVLIQAAELQVGLDICTASSHLAVLPDRIAQPVVARGELKRLDLDIVPPTPFFAAHRVSVGTHGPAEVVAAAVLSIALTDPHPPTPASNGTAASA